METPPHAPHGLSPRVRGNLDYSTERITVTRSIPACAGEPLPTFCQPLTYQVYPRVCGGTRAYAVIGQGLIGLSPRVRGNHGLSDQTA